MDLSSMKNFEIVCLHMWERSWLDKMRTVDRSTSPKERTKMSMQFNSAVRMIDTIRNTSKSPNNERKPFNVGLRTRHHQRHAEKKKRLICYRCGGKGHLARLCPSGDDCQVTNCALVWLRWVRLLLAPVVETTRELMSNESCLLDLLVAARNGNDNLQRKTVEKCVGQHKRGILGAVGHCEEFDPVLVHRAKTEEKDFTDKMGVYDVDPRSDAAEKGCRVIRTRWVTVNKGSDDAPQLRARGCPGVPWSLR